MRTEHTAAGAAVLGRAENTAAGAAVLGRAEHAVPSRGDAAVGHNVGRGLVPRVERGAT